MSVLNELNSIEPFVSSGGPVSICLKDASMLKQAALYDTLSVLRTFALFLK